MATSALRRGFASSPAARRRSAAVQICPRWASQASGHSEALPLHTACWRSAYLRIAAPKLTAHSYGLQGGCGFDLPRAAVRTGPLPGAVYVKPLPFPPCLLSLIAPSDSASVLPAPWPNSTRHSAAPTRRFYRPQPAGSSGATAASFRCCTTDSRDGLDLRGSAN